MNRADEFADFTAAGSAARLAPGKKRRNSHCLRRESDSPGSDSAAQLASKCLETSDDAQLDS